MPRLFSLRILGPSGPPILPGFLCWWALEVPWYAGAPTVLNLRQTRGPVDMGFLSGLTPHRLIDIVSKSLRTTQNTHHLCQPCFLPIINALAVSLGIEQEYTDNWGILQRTSLDTNQNILKALGVDVDTEARANKAWHVRQENQWSQLTEPAIVATFAGLPNELLFQIPRTQQGPSEDPSTPHLEVALEVTHENGNVQSFNFSRKDLTLRESNGVGERVYEHWGLPFPRLQALGYYKFHLSVSNGDERWSQVISVAICPQQAYMPPALEGESRVAGIGISLYGVRSERNWGIGDLGDLKEILRWAADDLHASLVGLNPLHATFNRRPFNTSPYLPMSRFYRNFIYLDVPAMEDYQDSPEAQDLVNAPETRRLLAEVRASHTVAYEKVAALKHNVLEKVFRGFLGKHWNGGKAKTDRHKDFEDYMEREGASLDHFATFCALDSALRSQDPEMWVWSQWPPEYHRPDTEAVRQFQEIRWEEVLFYKFIQWQLEEQLAHVQDYAKELGMSLGLYHDLALGVDRFSADFWAYQDFFVPGPRRMPSPNTAKIGASSCPTWRSLGRPGMTFLLKRSGRTALSSERCGLTT